MTTTSTDSRGGTPPHRHTLPEGECVTCDEHRGRMCPSHDASPRCQSGRRPHCTCDTCW